MLPFPTSPDNDGTNDAWNEKSGNKYIAKIAGTQHGPYNKADKVHKLKSSPCG
jgi:hypothetical protein